LIHRIFDQLGRIRREQHGVALHLRIAGWTVCSVAVAYRQSGTFDPFRDDRAWFTPRRTSEFGSGRGLHFDREVDPV
jgi:hypothetical protein